jgi:hypothetical protein
VASLKINDDQGYVTLQSSSGTTIGNCQFVDNPSPTDAPTEVDFKYDFLSFAISGVTAGGYATVSVYLPHGANPNTYFKYGPTPGNPEPD